LKVCFFVLACICLRFGSVSSHLFEKGLAKLLQNILQRLRASVLFCEKFSFASFAALSSLRTASLAFFWRRGRDSNPRTPFDVTRFPSVRTRPLCDLSLFYRLRNTEVWGPRDPNFSIPARSRRALAGGCRLGVVVFLRGTRPKLQYSCALAPCARCWVSFRRCVFFLCNCNLFFEFLNS
jgi:hypothetical protein